MQSDSEAARGLLNIVCDATIELDGQLQIMDETPRLASLLQHGCDRSLKGSCMLQFVVEEDRQLFTDRVCCACDESMANVFHVRVRDGISNIFNMEVFHVPVTGYLRADSHLIGLREHADFAEHAGSLPGGSEPKGTWTNDESAWKEADAADAEPRGPPRGSWSSSSSRSSARSISGREGEIVAWVELLSHGWEIKSFTSGFELFLGSGSRTCRLARGARELLVWVKPDQREPLIGWAQASYKEMSLRGTGPSQSPAARDFEIPVHFRPPSLWPAKVKVAYAASIAMALPKERQNKSTLVRLTFSDVRVVQLSSFVRRPSPVTL